MNFPFNHNNPLNSTSQGGNFSFFSPPLPNMSFNFSMPEVSLNHSYPSNVSPYNQNISANYNLEQPNNNHEQPFLGGAQIFFQSQIHSQLNNIFQKHAISLHFIHKLNLLKNFKIIFLLDDSTSMKTVDTPVGYFNGLKPQSRWNELLQFVNTSLEVALQLNPQGCDIYFLNRQPIKQCCDLNQLKYSFLNEPQGVTPLNKSIQQIINDNPPYMLQDKQLLLIIATDGEPTDIYGNPNVLQFKECLINRPIYMYTTIVACTNDEKSVGYLNNLDKELPRLDVVDDYRSELNEVRRVKGANFPFSFGDYIVKILLGSIDSELDNYDG